MYASWDQNRFYTAIAQILIIIILIIQISVIQLLWLQFKIFHKQNSSTESILQQSSGKVKEDFSLAMRLKVGPRGCFPPGEDQAVHYQELSDIEDQDGGQSSKRRKGYTCGDKFVIWSSVVMSIFGLAVIAFLIATQPPGTFKPRPTSDDTDDDGEKLNPVFCLFLLFVGWLFCGSLYWCLMTESDPADELDFYEEDVNLTGDDINGAHDDSDTSQVLNDADTAWM